MLRESGRVVAVDATGVWVETVRSSSCGRCAARAGCGHGALSAALPVGHGLIRASETGAVRAAHCALDDTVEIELPESAVLRASATVYGLPLLAAALMSVLLAGYGDVAAIGGFASGLALGFALVRRWGVRLGSDGVFEPRLVAVVNNNVIVRSGVSD